MFLAGPLVSGLRAPCRGTPLILLDDLMQGIQMEECQGGIIAVMGELAYGGQALQFGVKVRVQLTRRMPLLTVLVMLCFIS